ncbi:phage portal protein [Clostridium cadaveris]|uniref:phage portal protein n=1 Tax=Clostridium TaxID=1485 RepID=UPI000C075014|nr:phage portal protein [Clostridium cadaveris]MDU4952967.1 phage portal protein [Clostridium sp.]NME65688.1 phage portal protein [Clostridium cadaveris]
MRLFKKKENRAADIADPNGEAALFDMLLRAGLAVDNVSRSMACNVATLEGCVELISNTIAMIPIKLYKKENGAIREIEDDIRLKFLNDDTGDTLTAFDFKKALIQDYLLVGNGYAYINKQGTKIKSLHYVKAEELSINRNVDPIFKDYDILVNGKTYKPYQFLKVLRSSRDGSTGTGIIESNPILLSVAYNSLRYENILAKTGGNKKGFINSEKPLDQAAIDILKEQWNKMYSGNSQNCVVLNKGLTFQESAATPTEMQMNENKVTNGDEICKILNIPPSIISGDGKANTNDYEKMVKLAILPVITSFITCLNRDLLLESEKESFYFAPDLKELLKGDLEKRFKAYEIAIKNKILGVNEVRYEEDKPPIEALNDIVVLGLNDVLYNTRTGQVYTPNTDKKTDMNLKGGENIEN